MLSFRVLALTLPLKVAGRHTTQQNPGLAHKKQIAIVSCVRLNIRQNTHN